MCTDEIIVYEGTREPCKKIALRLLYDIVGKKTAERGAPGLTLAETFWLLEETISIRFPKSSYFPYSGKRNLKRKRERERERESYH